jgi:hypothetical protein
MLIPEKCFFCYGKQYNYNKLEENYDLLFQSFEKPRILAIILAKI